MDLYTSAARLARPFRVGNEPAPLGRHGLIGDGSTAALVGADGAIEWLCMPRFDSPSVCAALLDPERGGSFRISPVGRYESRQAYDDATNVLQTLFHQPDRGIAVVRTNTPPRDRLAQVSWEARK